MSIELPKRFEVVAVGGHPSMLFADCGLQICAFECVTCQESFTTKQAFAAHAKAAPETTHRPVRLCGKHGPEAPNAKGDESAIVPPVAGVPDDVVQSLDLEAR